MKNILVKYIENQDKYDKLFFLVCTFIFLFRLLYLDSDVPFFELAQIQPIDELYYNELAVKIYDNGFFSIFTGILSDVSVANAKTYLLPNLLTGLSMLIFGKNFWGLRIPYVAMSYACLCLLWKLSQKCFADSLAAKFVVPLLYLFDFNVLMLTRSGVTVVPCILACTIFMYVYIMKEGRGGTYVFMGCWSVVALDMVYMGMPFIFVSSVGILALELWRERRDFPIRRVELFGAGILLGILLCEFADYIILREHIWQVLSDTFHAHNNKMTHFSGLISYLRELWGYHMDYWASNVYKHNPFLAVIAIYALLMSLYLIVQKKDNRLYACFSVVGCHYLQTCFLPNMTESKSTISIVAIFLLVGFAIREIEQKNRAIPEYLDLAILFLAAFIAICAYTPLKNKVFYISQSVYFQYWFCMILFSVFTILLRKKQLLLLTLGIYFVSMMIFSAKYVYLKPSYEYRGICRDIGNVAGDSVTIGGFPVGFSLYNNTVPVVSTYDHYKGFGYDENYVNERIVEVTHAYDTVYWIGYASDNFSEMYSSMDDEYRYELVKIYQRSYCDSQNPGNSNIALYKKEPNYFKST